ncbi:hypothetical protein COCSADRAFT_297229 [Bipolaris sorokiniana ND90Pr]|uniref:Uncharacterized protein n=1 Tax=Cochliobolus sativus (strain ND90Pr / ATCC 201652) TaxID=665912 RepID=M2TBT5_COCSN|nr:uncharacterized protein COCSADRAFT_297229 [Bipolaris sorokiniana ND90Pr]EMD66322.1 hypothetical protein COCSADRAFT_297229 [Bipolaris sorokiniana ND90Pr]
MTQEKRERERNANRLSQSRKKERERERERYRTKKATLFIPSPIFFPLHNIKPPQKGPLKPATRSRPNLKRRWKGPRICRYGGPRPQATIIALGTHTCQYPKQRVYV